MALTTAELASIKYHLGYNELLVGAEPFIGVARVFEQVIQPYLQYGALTTSSTSVVAQTSPTPTTLVLASAVGFVAGDKVVVDVDSRQESAIVQSVSAPNITLLLQGAHSGTYAVTVEGGESIVRGILRKLQGISALGDVEGSGAIDTVTSAAGIKKVDEIEFFGGGHGSGAGVNAFDQLMRIQRYWRNELASALGVVNLREDRMGAGSTVSVY